MCTIAGRALVAILGLSSAALSCAQDPKRRVEGPLGARIAACAERAAAFGFAGALIAARGGKVVAALGVGFADLDDKVGNDANTLFELASVTKQFTAAAIMVLVQQQRLRLDDAIGEHLGGVPDNCKAITIRHLLQHTSGIPASNSRGSGGDLAAVLPEFLAGGPRHPPGSHWEYWNQGYALLAAIIERKSGGSYAEFCKRELFAKASMPTARFTGDDAPAGVAVAIGRSPRAAPRSALAHPYGDYGYQYRGMGGAVASVWDLWHWDRALRGNTVLQPASRKELFAPGLGDYALGWFVRRREGRLVQSHGGSVRGFVCDVRRYPDDDAFLAVLCSRSDAPFGELANAAEAILFGADRELPPAPLPFEVGKQLVGVWSCRDAAGSLQIEAHGSVLSVRLQWPGGPASRGFLVGKDLDHLAFFDWSVSLPLRLERTAGGAVAALRLFEATYVRQ